MRVPIRIHDQVKQLARWADSQPSPEEAMQRILDAIASM